ncbi:MAG: transketolase [Candidatus Omnitrophica bacterium]|nr:transketolase [Candidatus Omnitrophota bacterium]MBU4487741.1 transketolase [Candidatus Omnitrophota bacterium]MCG2705281.1 transketolase [Candidatus Omnitrophota bacterium]
MQRPSIDELNKKAKEIRRTVLKMLTEASSGHTGGSLSVVEIIISLYYCKMRHDPKNPGWQGRDRLVLSKGHACPTLYAVLAECGYFPKTELMTLRKFGTRLQGHPQLGLPGIEASTGSLGQGLSIAIGMALAARLDKKDTRVYCVMGDGELNEGQIWEAAASAAHYKLDNLCGIVDHNKLQIDGPCEEVMDMGPLKDKWASFGWNVLECDGHNIKELMDSLDSAERKKAKPTVILAHTVKGKGVSFVEHKAEWHGIAPKKEELDRALKELE